MAEPRGQLGRRAARGAVVTLSGQGGRILIQILSVVVLARLLTPTDYGLLAMVVAIVGIAEVVRDFGLSLAAVQARDLSPGQRSNLFWINTAIGVVLALAVLSSAPLLAALYDEDRLVDLARVLSVSFVFNGAATQYRADLNRRLLFGRLASAEVVAPALALAAALMAALLGAGYWALAVQQIGQSVVMLVSVVVLAGWLPRLPRRGEPMGHLLRFGGNLVGTQLIGYLANNLDSVVLGTRFGAGALGLYNRAFQLLMTPLNQVRSPTTTVALPVLARLQDQPREFNRFVLRGQAALGFTIVPVLALVVGASTPVTSIFLGARWTEVSPLLALLACAGIFQTLAYVGYWVYLAKGLARDLFRYTLVTVSIKVVCILVGSTWGVVGVAAGYAVAPLIAWPLSLWWLSRAADLDTGPLYGGAARIVLLGTAVAGSSGLVSVLTDDLPSAVRLLLSVIASAVVAGLLALVVGPVRRDVRDLARIGRATVRRRSVTHP